MAELTVTGEVRTLDPSGQPGLWGRGRPDIEVYGSPALGGICLNRPIKYGLSGTGVTWGAAASACPAGTWVCNKLEIVACNTDPPNTAIDKIACDGTERDLEENLHEGWTANGGVTSVCGRPCGIQMRENGVQNNDETCETMPVWCCWE